MSDVYVTDKEFEQYCKGLKFDQAGHEMHSLHVIAWTERHKN